MLPSRGAIRPGQVIGLRYGSLRNLSRRRVDAGSSRQFGTTLRSNGRPQSLSPPIASSSQRSLGAFPALAGVFHFSLLGHHTRFASTTPSPSPAPIPPSEPIAPHPSTQVDLDLSTLDIQTTAASDLPVQIGYLHSLGLDFGWGPTSTMQWLLEHVAAYTGLPWWTSIAAVCVMVRLAVFKPSLTAAEMSLRTVKLRQDPRYLEAWERAKAGARGNREEARAATMEIQRITRLHGVKMWKTFIPFINIPIGFAMFRLLRGMATLPVPGLETGGLLWFQDLSVHDPFFILPVASAGMMYLSIQRSLKYMNPEQARMMSVLSYVLVPVGLFVTMKMAAALQFFFLVSSVLQYLQTSATYNPAVRRWARLPRLVLGGDPSMPSPFANMRTLQDQQQQKRQAETSTPRGVTSNVKGAIAQAREKAKEYMKDKSGDRDYAAAERYEAKRAAEDQLKYTQSGHLAQHAKKQWKKH